jgi:hypothetical protein
MTAYPAAFPYIDKPHLPRDRTANSGLDPPLPFSNQEKAPQANPMEAIPQASFPFPRNVKGQPRLVITILMCVVCTRLYLGF